VRTLIVQTLPMESMAVCVYTEDFIIKGNIHLPKNGRLSDYINMDKKFFPVTQAIVYSFVDEKEIQKAESLIINQNEIIMVMPQKEESKTSENDSRYVILKDKRLVHIYIKKFIIDGTICLPKRGELFDYINVNRKFLPVTDVSFYLLNSNKEKKNIKFLLINRNSVIILLLKENKDKSLKEKSDEKTP